jgi:hypothetical protein
MQQHQKSDKSKVNVWDLDLRVRERNLHTGQLDGKAVQKYLADLPDLEGHFEIVDEHQPALGDGGED